MLRLHAAKAEAGEPLKVVADQVGCPTSTLTLAKACWRAIGIDANPDGPRCCIGVMPARPVGTTSPWPLASWRKPKASEAATVEPITTADYPNPATAQLLTAGLHRLASGPWTASGALA